MKPPMIDKILGGDDYPSRALLLPLSNKLSGLTKGAAYAQAENATQSMSKVERAKLNRLVNVLINDEQLVGGIAKAARRAGIGHELLEKWMNTPSISSAINCAAREGASELLFWGKVSLQLQKDSLASAKLASQNLNAFKSRIRLMAEKGDKKFFIDLGKCLSGEIKCELWDRFDEDVTDVLCRYPKLSAKDAVLELKKRGWTMTEEGFRMWKHRLLRAARDARKAWAKLIEET
jgi:hypothetical protein